MKSLVMTSQKFRFTADEFFILGIAAASIAVNLFSPAALAGGMATWNDLSWTLISLLTAIRCYTAARTSDTSLRTTWNMIGLGCTLWFMGMLAWDYYRLILGIQTPFPSLADMGYLLLAPCATVALIYFANESLTTKNLLYQFTRIGVIFFALLVIHFLIFSSVITAPHISSLYLITSLSYPLLFITTLIHMVSSPWYRYSGRQQTIVLYIFTGLMIHTLANAEYAYILLDLGYYSSAYLDVAWTVGFVPIYLATSYAGRTKETASPRTQKYFVWFSRSLDKVFLPVILTGLAIAIFSYRDLIINEASEGFTILIIIFSVMLIGYMWLTEEKEHSYATQLYAKDLILESLVDAIPYGIQENDLEGNIVYSNEAHHNILAAKPDTLPGRKTWDAARTDEQQQQLQQRLHHIVNSRPRPGSFIDWMVRDNGQSILLKTDWNYRHGPFGNLTGIVSVITDITSQHETEERLKQAATVFSSTTDGVIVTDKDRNITAVNRAFTRISGYRESEVIGKNPRILQSHHHTPVFYQSMWKSISEKGYWNGEIHDQKKNGSLYPAWLSISTVKDDNGEVTNYVAVFSDISRIKESEEHLKFLAHHDPLTELANRNNLDISIEQAIKRSVRNGNNFALFFIDLDQFKHINDSLGHTVGDRILIEVAKRLNHIARFEDVVSRLGGDEFVLLTESVATLHDSVSVAERIIHQFTTPFEVDELQLHITPSIGIASYPENGTSAETLLRNADAAMYRAKQDGRNSFAYYSEELTTRATERIKYENLLRQALERDEFTLHFQPQIDMQAGRIYGVEVLLRWQHPVEGMIPPETFIPIAEESGLIAPIGEWVLRQSCMFMQELRRTGIELKRISVNVSGFQFVRGNFVKLVDTILQETGLDAGYLELEITESMIMKEKTKSVDVLYELGRLGISLSIDDFGTGYSSLSYLKKLPVHNIKIDRSFIRDIAIDKDDEAIVRSIIALGHALNLGIIAEGVETSRQLDFLQQEGCHLIQGYLFSHPIPGEDLVRLLKQPLQRVP